MPGDTDAVLSRQTHIEDDHILVDLEFEDDLRGRLSGEVSFSRSTIGTLKDKDDGLVKTAAIDVARFEAEGWLCEGGSTNEFIRVEELDNAVWFKNQSPVTANATIAPDGNMTADKLIPNTSNVQHDIRQTVTTISATEYTASDFIKSTGEGISKLLRTVNGSFVSVNATDGSIISQSGLNANVRTIVNGWFRISVTDLEDVGNAEQFRLQLILDDGATVFAGDGVSGVFDWGPQVEKLPFASSYIKTVLTTESRDSDNLTINAVNIPAPTDDYTVSMEIDVLGLDSTKTQTVYSVDGETSRKIEVNTTTGLIEATHGGVTIASTTAITPNTSIEVAFTVGATNQTLYINRVQEAQSAKGTVAGAATAISIGNAAGSDQLFGHEKNFRIYDIELTPDQVVNPNLVTEFVSVDFDISFDTDGDILTDDFFDTSLLYSLLGERRADSSEVVEPQLRRGWIGSEGKDFENGSKLWLFEQARVTRSNLNRIEDEARKALQWLVDDGFAVSVDEVIATVKNGKVSLEIVIRRSRSEVERRFFDLWQNTGVR